MHPIEAVRHEAQRLGISAATVFSGFKGAKYSEARGLAIVRAYEAGFSKNKIAFELGCDRQTVYYHLRKRGVI